MTFIALVGDDAFFHPGAPGIDSALTENKTETRRPGAPIVGPMPCGSIQQLIGLAQPGGFNNMQFNGFGPWYQSALNPNIAFMDVAGQLRKTEG